VTAQVTLAGELLAAGFARVSGGHVLRYEVSPHVLSCRKGRLTFETFLICIFCAMGFSDMLISVEEVRESHVADGADCTELLLLLLLLLLALNPRRTLLVVLLPLIMLWLMDHRDVFVEGGVSGGLKAALLAFVRLLLHVHGHNVLLHVRLL